MNLKSILANTLLITSLVSSPVYAQETTKDYLTEKATEKIDEKVSEKIIETAVNKLLRKPSLETIIQRKINPSQEIIGVIQERKIDYCKNDVFLPNFTIYLTSNQHDPKSPEKGKVIDHEETPIVFGWKKDGKYYLHYTTKNSVETVVNKLLRKPSSREIIPIRLNDSETRCYVFHQENSPVTQIEQVALYKSGKEEKLIPLEDSPNKKFILEAGKKAVIITLKKLKIANAEQYLETAEEKYRKREQEIMDELAREINPNYLATRIPLYPARIFSETEIGRTISFKLESKNPKKETLAIYLKPTFENEFSSSGAAEITRGDFEVLLRDD